MFSKPILRFLFVMAMPLMMMACDKEKAKENGEIMIVNASPGLANLAISVDGAPFGSGTLSYPGNTSYRTLVEGSHVLKAAQSGTNLFEGSLSTIANARQSLYLYDRSTQLKAFAVVDNITLPPSGKAMLRFFNLSPNSPVVDAGVFVGAAFTPIFSGRPFEDNTTAFNNSSFQTVDAGTFKFQLRVNGAAVILSEIPSLVLESGKSYTIFAKGISGDTDSPLGLEVISNN